MISSQVTDEVFIFFKISSHTLLKFLFISRFEYLNTFNPNFFKYSSLCTSFFAIFGHYQLMWNYLFYSFPPHPPQAVPLPLKGKALSYYTPFSRFRQPTLPTGVHLLRILRRIFLHLCSFRERLLR